MTATQCRYGHRTYRYSEDLYYAAELNHAHGRDHAVTRRLHDHSARVLRRYAGHVKECARCHDYEAAMRNLPPLTIPADSDVPF